MDLSDSKIIGYSEVLVENRELFCTHVYLASSLREFPLELAIAGWIQKWGYQVKEKG